MLLDVWRREPALAIPPLTAGQHTRSAVMRAHNNVCRRHTFQEHPSLL